MRAGQASRGSGRLQRDSAGGDTDSAGWKGDVRGKANQTDKYMAVKD